MSASEDAGPRRGWIVRRTKNEKRSILYKGVETSP